MDGRSTETRLMEVNLCQFKLNGVEVVFSREGTLKGSKHVPRVETSFERHRGNSFHNPDSIYYTLVQIICRLFIP